MMEQATNTFTKGLLTDIHPMMLTNEVLSDCLNGTVITMNGNEPALLNDMGNVRVEDANLPSGYTPVGMKEYGGVIYVAAFNPVTGKSLIGSFPSPERKKSLDDDLKATFDFSQFEKDSYYLDLYFLKNDSYLVPLTGSIALHVGDKFVIYSTSELSTIKNLITNWNNVYEEYDKEDKLIKGIAYSPKNRKYTIQVGILNEQNEFIDITKSLVRWEGNLKIDDFVSDSEIYKFNKGFHIAIEDNQGGWKNKVTGDDRQFILNRQAKPINNFSYKLAGPLYLKVSYNHVQSFNYDIEGQVNGNTIEITIKGYFTYNCPDKVNKNKEYIFKTFKEKVTFGDDHNPNNPNNWAVLSVEYLKDGYTGPEEYKWKLYKDYRNKTLLNYTYVSSREKNNNNWGQFSTPQLVESKYFVTSDDYYTYDLAYEIDLELINYDVEFKLYHNDGNSYEYVSKSESSTYSNIEYNPITNLYSCELEKKYTLTYNNKLGNLIQDKLEYKIKTYSGLTKTEKENYTIYLKNLCYNGIIDLSLLNSGELTLKQYKFYNKLATKDNEKNLSLLLLRFESYPKEGESRRNLKIEFRNINTSEALTPKRLITDLRITNGVIQLPFTWEQVKLYNSSTEKWDINNLLDSRKVYDVKIYYDLYKNDLFVSELLYEDIVTLEWDTEDLQLETRRWFLTTELFNDLYSDLSGIDDYCTTDDERITNIDIKNDNKVEITPIYKTVDEFPYYTQYQNASEYIIKLEISFSTNINSFSLPEIYPSYIDLYVLGYIPENIQNYYIDETLISDNLLTLNYVANIYDTISLSKKSVEIKTTVTETGGTSEKCLVTVENTNISETDSEHGSGLDLIFASDTTPEESNPSDHDYTKHISLYIDNKDNYDIIYFNPYTKGSGDSGVDWNSDLSKRFLLARNKNEEWIIITLNDPGCIDNLLRVKILLDFYPNYIKKYTSNMLLYTTEKEKNVITYAVIAKLDSTNIVVQKADGLYKYNLETSLFDLYNNILPEIHKLKYGNLCFIINNVPVTYKVIYLETNRDIYYQYQLYKNKSSISNIDLQTGKQVLNIDYQLNKKLYNDHIYITPKNIETLFTAICTGESSSCNGTIYFKFYDINENLV